MSFDEDRALVESLAGLTIVSATWGDHSPNEDWTDHEYAELTLSDGRVIEFGGWGHDAWGATVFDVTPKVDTDSATD